MLEEIGNRNFPIWLLGDSPPEKWKRNLEFPLDSRHPIRHNIWTSVLDVIQQEVYRHNQKRFNSESVYIRNAISDVGHKPEDNVEEWKPKAIEDFNLYKRLIRKYKPRLVITFGALSFEFGRRIMNNKIHLKYKNWDTTELGNEFKVSIKNYDRQKTNFIPLLHRSIAGGGFLVSHKNFTGLPNANYFEYVGKEISKLIIDIGMNEPIYL